MDDYTVYKVPSKFLKGVNALATAPGVVTSPVQVDNTKYNDNIPGRFGELVEQLLYTGAFVLEHFKNTSSQLQILSLLLKNQPKARQ